ncbi:hypothetical protein [Marinoscillum sp.]
MKSNQKSGQNYLFQPYPIIIGAIARPEFCRAIPPMRRGFRFMPVERSG